MGRFDEVKQFINKRAADFPNLDVVYARGLDPVLDLTTSDGETESMGIGSWKLDQITEFVKQKLVAAPPHSVAEQASEQGDASGDGLTSEQGDASGDEL